MADDKDQRVVDLNDMNFRNKDVMKWSDRPGGETINYGKSNFGLRTTANSVAIPRIKRR
jgi:hypothetical protein